MPAHPRFSGLVLLAAIGLVAPARAQHPNVQVSLPGTTDAEEMTVAIDPLNPQRIGAAANIRYRFASQDGGQTWSGGLLTSSYGVVGDPVVLFDLQGNLYYAHLSTGLDRIVVQRSTDGGASYDDGVGIGFNPNKDQDKPWLTCDFSGSPWRHDLYLAWTEFDKYGSALPSDSTRILFSRSSDLGQSWSVPLRLNERAGNCIDSDGTVEGAVPAVGPEGQVYVAWSGPTGIRLDRSLDGGLTFGSDILVSTQPGGWDFEVSGIFRSNGLPTTLCDISHSPYRGRIYVVWSDQRAGVGDTDVFVARSLDGGQTWLPPQRVNDDPPGRHQFFPAAAVDSKTGILYVAYYDRRATTGDATEVYLSRSTDGGQTFQSLQVSDLPFTPESALFFGDYIGLAVWNRTVHAVWMRMDSFNLSAWAARWTDPYDLVAVTRSPAPGRLELIGASPNPLRGATRLGYRLPVAGEVTVTVADVQGREVARLERGRREAGEHWVPWDASGHPPGLYFWRVEAAGTSRAGKLIVAR